MRFKALRFWLLLAASVTLFFVGLGFVYVRVIDPPDFIEVTVTTNGTSRLYGLPVSDKRVRRCVFWLTSKFRSKDTEIRIRYANNTPGHSLLDTNTLAIMMDLGRAGLTNRPPP